MSVVIGLGRVDASKALDDVYSKLATPEMRTALMKVVGVRTEQELRAWFMRRDADSPNKHGWPRQHFWARIAKRTAFDASRTTESTATVVISDPALMAKVKGATIRPTGAVSPVTGRPTKNIAIPLQGAVYGSWPRGNPVPGLFFIRKTHGNGGFLVTAEGKGKDRQLTFWYRLLPEVTVPEDPQALPPLGDLQDAAGEAASEFFLRNSGGPN